MVSAKSFQACFSIISFVQTASIPIGFNKRCDVLSESVSLVESLLDYTPSVISDVTDLGNEVVSLVTELSSVSAGDYLSLLSTTYLSEVNDIAEDITDLSNTTLALISEIDWTCFIEGDLIGDVVNDFTSIGEKTLYFADNLETLIGDATDSNILQGSYDFFKDLYNPIEDLLGVLKKAESLIPNIGDSLVNATNVLEHVNTEIHDVLTEL